MALGFMSFVLLLLLAVTALSQVEIRSAEISKHRLLAKENARLGLMIALGNLQKHAGPDQRVTARAEILGNTVSEGARYWTGAWNTEDPNVDPAWLVSGEFPDPENAPHGTDLMTVVGPASTNLTATSYSDQTVRVPYLEITGSDAQPSAKIAR